MILVVILLTLLVVLIVLNLRPHQVRLDQKIDISYSVTDVQFRQTMGHLLSTPVVEGNKIQALHNGQQIFPAMLQAILSAKKSVTFESYIYWSGNIGQKFLEALTERAKAGVKVHVLIDWLGSQKIEDDYIQKLKSAGVEVEFYHPLHWYNVFRMNNRTHRKILVIDGKKGFTGGVGISDDWIGNGDKPNIWRDTHYFIEGPAASFLQTAFMDNWLKTRPEVLHDENYFPVVEREGTVKAQIFLSSPREGGASMRLMYLMAIAAAKNNLRIASAYFVPDDLTSEELIKARKRGVQVQVIVPGPFIDSSVVKTASRSTWGKLLENGIEIYEFLPAKYHNKLLIADGYFISVGSTNFDDRSFRLNNESNLNVFDETFAVAQVEVFENDLKKSRKVTLKSWQERSMTEKIKELFLLAFRNQL